MSHSQGVKSIFKISCLTTLLLLGCKSQQSVPISDSAVKTQVVDSIVFAEKKVTNELVPTNETKVEKIFIEPSSFARNITDYLKGSEIFSSHFTGLSLFDIQKNKFIINYNGNKFFTPASNVKILTLYASLKSFKGSLPGMLYRDTKDTLFVQPVGDPTFLHKDYSFQPALIKMQNAKKPIAIEWPSEKMNAFGEGWMWDDYNSGYMPELSWMPMYGNVVQFRYERPNVSAHPPLFNDLVEVHKVWNGRTNTVKRSLHFNYFDAQIRYPNWNFDKSVPFKFSKNLAQKLLKEAVGAKISIIPPRQLRMDTLYSYPVDTVLRKMMHSSDNFISEQLLIMASLKNGFSDTEAFREYITANWLPDMSPVWIDGSGLSRYNLIRPEDKVKLLSKLYREFGWYRIHNIFPHGGISGTIKNWYPNQKPIEQPTVPVKPYIIAKTGTLSNNHNLSGYLQTASGKLLIFSFMNNNFVCRTNQIKQEMQSLLEAIRDSY